MRPVRGTVVSSRPASLSRAAAVLASFAASDNCAPREVQAYIHRASRAFDELLLLHRDIRAGTKTPRPDKIPISAHPNGGASGGRGDEDGEEEKRAKKKKRRDEVDLIPRQPDEEASGEIDAEEEGRRRKKKKRKRDGSDSIGDGVLIPRLPDMEARGGIDAEEGRKKNKKRDGSDPTGNGVLIPRQGIRNPNEGNVDETREGGVNEEKKSLGGENEWVKDEWREHGESKKKKKKKKEKRKEERGIEGQSEGNVKVEEESLEERSEERKKKKKEMNAVVESLDYAGRYTDAKKRKHLEDGGRSGEDQSEDHRHKKKKKRVKMEEQ